MKKLTKQNIQFIDNYLKNSGIEYLDVRVELLDHVASTLEAQLNEDNTLTFYDAFKNYMVANKKQLLTDYNARKQDVFLKVIYQHGKSFLKGDTVVLLFVLILVQQYFQFKIDENIFQYTNFLLLLLMIVTSLLFFRKERKTSLGSQVLTSLVLPYYVFGGKANPISAIFLCLFFVIYYKLFNKYKKMLIDKNRNLATYITLGALIVCWFSISIFLVKLTKEYINNTIITYYYIFQLVAWYALFKSLFYYKAEIRNQYKIILEEN